MVFRLLSTLEMSRGMRLEPVPGISPKTSPAYRYVFVLVPFVYIRSVHCPNLVAVLVHHVVAGVHVFHLRELSSTLLGTHYSLTSSSPRVLLTYSYPLVGDG